jgi:hypothetical protein
VLSLSATCKYSDARASDDYAYKNNEVDITKEESLDPDERINRYRLLSPSAEKITEEKRPYQDKDE